MAKIYKQKIFLVFSFVLSLILISCGGGGGGGTSSPQLSSAKAISSYSVIDSQGESRTAIIKGKEIAVYVPYNTNVESLVAVYKTTGVSVSVNSGGKNTVQISGRTYNNFSKPVTYVVKAANGSTDSYRVTVTKSLESENTMIGFSLKDKAGIDHPGIVDNGVIEVEMPYGTDLESLVATFKYSGSYIEVGGVHQISGKTANDFTNSVTYNVTAYNNNVNSYTVIVKVAKSSAKEISYFAINDKDGVRVGHNIDVSLPYKTDVTNLVAIFNTNAEKVTVNGGVESQSGKGDDKPINFTKPATFTAHAYDGSTVDYTVTVHVESASDRKITQFSISGYPSSSVTVPDESKDIDLILPNGTSRDNLVARFSYEGEKVTVNGGVESQSGDGTDKPINFNVPATFTVHAANGQTRDYAVRVNVGESSAKEITAFSLDGYKGAIDGNNITVVLPNGYSLNSSLLVKYTTNGAKFVTVDGKLVTDDETRTFTTTSPVTYRVHAADTTTRDYIVTVKKAPKVHTYVFMPYVDRIYMKNSDGYNYSNIVANQSYFDVEFERYHAYGMVASPDKTFLAVGKQDDGVGQQRFQTISINSDGSLKQWNTNFRLVGNGIFTPKMVISPDKKNLYQVYVDKNGIPAIDKNNIALSGNQSGEITFEENGSYAFNQAYSIGGLAITPNGKNLYPVYEYIRILNRDLANGNLTLNTTWINSEQNFTDIVINKTGTLAFVSNKKGSNAYSDVFVFKINSNGTLSKISSITSSSIAYYAKSMTLDPNGKYLYVAWQMQTSESIKPTEIIAYSIDQASGALTQKSITKLYSSDKLAMSIDDTGSTLALASCYKNNDIYFANNNGYVEMYYLNEGKLIYTSSIYLGYWDYNSATTIVMKNY
ncbi:MAG: hypothetical protein ACK5WP_04165 [Neisseriaceae bacterium]